jgi:hypothetical protein
MGWKLKGLAFVFAVLAALTGAWIIAAPLFVYVFWGAIFRKKKAPAQVQVNVRYPDQRPGASGEAATAKPPEQAPQEYQHGRAEDASRRFGSSTRYIVGGVLLLLALVALGDGGTFSPLVFAAPGLTLIFWDRIWRSAEFSAFRPERESVLMRRPDVPFLWFALAEVKFATRNVATALASIDERIVVANYDKPTVYVLFSGAELSHKRAEAKILEKMRETQMTVAPLGAFLLPVDGERAVASMGFSTKPVKVDPEALSHSLFTLPYEMLSLRPKGGYVDSLGVYVRNEDRRKAGEVVVPAPRQKPSRRPLLWETLRLVERKLRWPEPDAQTAFLGTMFATREETLGERIVEAGNTPDARVVTVKSVGSPQIELTRPQLRAVVKVYASTVAQGR